jgi:RNA 3'-terminal phosphate cyclase (ATP)
MRRMGVEVEIEMVRPGFYPRGGGEIRAVIHPCSRVNGLHITTCPELTTAGGFSAYAGLPESVGQRQARRLSVRLKSEGVESHIPVEEWQALNPSTVAAVIFRQAPIPALFYGLGERGKSAESVADDAADEAIAFRDAKCPVDPHSADQLLLPLAFSPDASEYRTSEVTRHLTTNIATVRKFLDRDITVDAEERQPGTVRIAAVV